MIKLYLYPSLFGLEDNNPFGLKVSSFLRINKINHEIINTIDTSDAPRGQLPYINDDGVIVSDSNKIIEYVKQKYKLKLDLKLTLRKESQAFLVTRMLDEHLYWVISYSRWQDETNWFQFKSEFLKSFSGIKGYELDQAKDYNIEKYQLQGIGRYNKNEIYQSGIDDIKSIEVLLGDNDFIFGAEATTVDCTCYSFLSCIYFYQIDTPLKAYISQSMALSKYIGRVQKLLDKA